MDFLAFSSTVPLPTENFYAFVEIVKIISALDITTTSVQQVMDSTLDPRLSKDVTREKPAKQMLSIQVYVEDCFYTVRINVNMTKLDIEHLVSLI